MADSTITVEIGADVSGFTSGVATASSGFQRLAAATAENARAQAILGSQLKIIKELDDAEAVSNDVLAASLQRAAAASAELAAAQDALKVSSGGGTAAVGGLERVLAQAGGRALGAAGGMGMMGGAIGRVAGILPGLSTAFAVALPIALIALAIEKIEEFRENIAKAVREDDNLAIASFKVADSVQLENDKLEDQIAKLQGFPEKNRLAEALLEAKAAAEDLTKSLNETLQKENDLLNVGIFSQFFAAASGNEKDAAERMQPFLNQIIAARLKLAEAPPGSDQANSAIEQQIDLYTKLNAQISKEVLNLEAAGVTKTGEFKDADSIAKLQSQSITAMNAVAALKSELKQEPLRVQVAGLENQKDQIAETERQIDAERRLRDTTQETLQLQIEAAKTPTVEAAKSLPEFTTTQVDQKKAAMKAALEDERTDALVNANAIFQIAVEEDAKETALYQVGSEGYKKALAKRLQDDGDYEKQKATINKDYDARIGDSNRELENKYRELLDKRIGDEAAAEQKMAELRIEQNKKALDQMLKDDDNAMAIRQAHEKAQGTGLAPGPIADALKLQQAIEEYKEYDAEIQKLTQTLVQYTLISAKLHAIEAGGGILTPQQVAEVKAADENVSALTNAIERLRLKQVQLQAEMLSSWQQIGKAIENAAEKGLQTFNQNILQMIEKGQSFKKTMINVWNSMAESLIESMLQLGEKMLINWVKSLLGIQTEQAAGDTAQIAQAKTTSEAIVMSDAGTAGAAGFASAMQALPFPINVAVAPGVGGDAVAQTLAFGQFERGGLIGGMRGEAVPIIGHAGEHVLNEPVTAFVRQAAAASIAGGRGIPTGGGASGGGSSSTVNKNLTNNMRQENHFHKVADMSDRQIARMVKSAARKGLVRLADI